jgi:hypothetical protein
LVSSALAETKKGKWYPPGSPECYAGGGSGSSGNLGCIIYEGEPLEGIALALAIIGTLVFAASIVAYIIWSIRKDKRQQSL